MADMSSDQKDEFKLSFKPSSINISGNNGSHPHWMTSSINTNFQNQFTNQSSSSILLSGFNDNSNNNNKSHNNNNNNTSIFNNTNNNNNIINTSISHLPIDSEIIFNQSVPIIIKTSMTETNTRNLTLKIEKITQLPQNQNILSITLTDESDPFFLYTLVVTENDFHHLKSDQTLLVDFTVFPKSLVMLLKQCLECANNEHPKFVAVLIYDNSRNNNNKYSILSVQETNQFRHLQHISLRLVLADNDKLREYLGKQLIIYKTECIKLNKLYFDSKQNLHKISLDKKQTENYVTEIKQKYEQCLCDLKTNHSSQISLLKQNNLEEINELRKEFENKKCDIENELKLQIKNNNLKYNKLRDEFDILNTNYLTIENKYKNDKNIYLEMEKQFENNKIELSKLRNEYKELDILKFKYEKEINEHLINISAYKQQIKDKTEINLNTSNLLNSEKEQKKSMEQQLKLYKLNFEKSEKKVKECIKEINKGNNIISHLQNEIRNQRNKNKLKEQKLLNMEQIHSNNNSENNKLNEQMKNILNDNNKYKNEIKELKNTLRQCKDKLQQSQKAIESNQRVISYLNKQLNDNQINGNIFSTHISNNNHSNQIGIAPSPLHNTYRSPYLNKINTNITATSPILNNVNHNKSSPSSYFPQ